MRIYGVVFVILSITHPGMRLKRLTSDSAHTPPMRLSFIRLKPVNDLYTSPFICVTDIVVIVIY